jgi:chromosome segregation ATPase
MAMDNAIKETNKKLEEIISVLNENKEKYQEKYNEINKIINNKLEMVKEYKEAYYEAKEKIDNLNADIEEFKEEYKKLVDKFKDDELSNILVGANKEISAKINERKLTIQKDTDAMNKLVSDAEDIKKELIKLNAEKKALEILLNKSMDISKFYESTLSDIIAYSNENPDNLCGYFKQDKTKVSQKHTNVKKNNKRISDKVTSEAFDLDSIISNDIVKN